MQAKSLSGLVALVTGAGGGEGGGTGAGIARCLAREGAAVAVNDLRAEYAERTVAQLRAMGAEALAVAGDVSSSTEANAMVQAVVAHFGQLNILVNNAGVSGRGPAVERMPDEIWFRTVAVDLTGPFNMCRAALQVMLPRRFGRIINISSLSGQRTSYMSGAAYTAAKSGLLGFTRHLAVEVAEYGINVNAIMPGGTLTPPLVQNNPPEVPAALAATVPMQRLADPEDIGSVAAFLASPASTYVTGVAIPVDGGLTCLTGNFVGYKANSRKDAG